MSKVKLYLMYFFSAIIYLLVIPEAIIRLLTPEQLADLAYFTSIGHLVSPLLSLLVFLVIISFVLSIFTVVMIRRIFWR